MRRENVLGAMQILGMAGLLMGAVGITKQGIDSEMREDQRRETSAIMQGDRWTVISLVDSSLLEVSGRARILDLWPNPEERSQEALEGAEEIAQRCEVIGQAASYGGRVLIVLREGTICR